MRDLDLMTIEDWERKKNAAGLMQKKFNGMAASLMCSRGQRLSRLKRFSQIDMTWQLTMPIGSYHLPYLFPTIAFTSRPIFGLWHMNRSYVTLLLAPLVWFARIQKYTFASLNCIYFFTLKLLNACFPCSILHEFLIKQGNELMVSKLGLWLR